MKQYKTENKSTVHITESKPTNVSLKNIDTVARELQIDETRVVLVNVDFVLALEKRIKTLEGQVSSLTSAKNMLLQKVRNIK